MKPLDDYSIRVLAYFIQFCDGIRDTGKRSRPLLCGSGRGSAWLGEAFNDKEPKLAMLKCARRGFVSRDPAATGRWRPTVAGRAIVSMNREPVAEVGG